MKKTTYLKELRELGVVDLRAKAVGLAEELMKLRFRKASGQQQQTHRMQEARRGLAQVQTVLKEKVTS